MDANEQIFGNLLVALANGNQAQDVHLSWG
jgi:hypothetical protein